MNDELRELIRKVLVQTELTKNLVDISYEFDDSERREVIERVSLVYEVKDLKEGFD